jgi:hypothetical protein
MTEKGYATSKVPSLKGRASALAAMSARAPGHSLEALSAATSSMAGLTTSFSASLSAPVGHRIHAERPGDAARGPELRRQCPKRVVLPALLRPTTHGTLAEGLSETPSGPHVVG